MGFTVYDCRKDIRNILVTPQIRARFCRMEPGPGSLDKFHTHGLGPRDLHYFVGTGGVQDQRRDERTRAGADVLCPRGRASFCGAFLEMNRCICTFR